MSFFRNNRLIFLTIAGVCFALVGFALYLQHAHDLEPCPLCIVQRIAFIGAGILAIAGASLAPLARTRWYPVVVAVPLLTGVITAIRHVWIEHFPPETLSCGGYGLAQMLDKLPLTELVPAIFRGTGDCGEVLWRFAGLSIAGWSLIWLSLLLAYDLVALRNSIHSNSTRTETRAAKPHAKPHID